MFSCITPCIIGTTCRYQKRDKTAFSAWHFRISNACSTPEKAPIIAEQNAQGTGDGVQGHSAPAPGVWGFSARDLKANSQWKCNRLIIFFMLKKLTDAINLTMNYRLIKNVSKIKC